MTAFGRSVVALAVSILVLLTGAAGTLMLDRDDMPDVSALLRSAQHWVGDHDTVHFTSVSHFDDANDPSLSNRLRSEGDIRDGQFRFRVRFGFGFHGEILSVGGKTYGRQGRGQRELDKAKWGELPSTPGPGGPHTVEEESLTAPLSLTPGRVLSVVAAVKHPVLVEKKDADGWLQLTGDVDVDKAFPDAGGTLDGATADLRVSRSGRLNRLVVKLHGPAGRGTADLQLTRWGERVRLAAPASDQIDPTPGLQEEAIAAFHEAPLLQPVAIPAGWVLDTAEVLATGEGNGDCPTVEIFYTDPNNPDGGYLDLYESASGCATSAPVAGARPFAAGTGAGLLDPDPGDGSLSGVVTHGATAIHFETDLDLPTVAAALGSVRPLDLSVVPGALAAVSSSA